jgi:hypothetical protein
MTPSRDISRLLDIIAALRTPVTGCPWDVQSKLLAPCHPKKMPPEGGCRLDYQLVD